MILVTRLDASTMIVNDDQIAWIDTHSDTMISMMNGDKLLVRETPDELVDRTASSAGPEGGKLRSLVQGAAAVIVFGGALGAYS